MGNSESNLTTREAVEQATGNGTGIGIGIGEQTPRGRRRLRRSRHLSGRSTEPAADTTDPWWWEIENQNLILDQVPNIATSPSESESVPATSTADDGARTPLKIVEHVAMTLNENQKQDHAVAVAVAVTEGVAVVAETAAAEAAAEIVTKTDTRHSDGESHVAEESTLPSVVQPREQSLEEFREELRVKRLARQTAVQDLRDEIATLRRQLATEQAMTRSLRESRESTEVEGVAAANEAEEMQLETLDTLQWTQAVGEAAAGSLTPPPIDEDDIDPEARSRHANIELANAQLALQLANADNISLRTELGVVQRQVGTLKEVIACCKQMLAVKEEQCTQLKTKLQEIETSFTEREMKIMSNNLRQEYERQLVNIRQLRNLYEERQRVAAAEYDSLQRLIAIKRDELIAEQEKTKNFEERNQTLVREVETANNELATLREECSEHKFEKRALKEEMGAVNTLFSQMVMGFNGENNLDIDRLTQMLEENRALLNDITQREGSCTEGATLPKLLFELVEQAAIADAKAKSRSTTPTPTATMPIPTTSLPEDMPATFAAAAVVVPPNPDRVDMDAATTATATTTMTTTTTSTTTGGSDVTDCSALDVMEATECNDNVAKTNNGIGKRHRRRLACGAEVLTVTTATTATAGAGAAAAAAAAAVSLKCHEPEIMCKVASAQEIIGNLPKVWKVLLELLSHHKNEQVKCVEHADDCYKSVETATGTKTELSVSKTYIRLKDLILEKKSLVKETNRLKTLNSHLEYRLNEREKRLSAVSLELTKTWHLVGKMQRQHRQLHTQEQILRYQLQQKRRLLSELKDEIEYCRRKWAAARAKNDESQEQCDDLRREFARRKLEDANHSAESGYSDSGPQTDDEERTAGSEDISVGVAAAAAAAAAELAIEDVVVVGVGVGVVAKPANVVAASCRRKYLKELFEHTRKIKRMQSTSPGRATTSSAAAVAAAGTSVATTTTLEASTSAAAGNEEIVLRWNSAPPTCGWREGDDDDDDEDDGIGDGVDVGDVDAAAAGANGSLDSTASPQRTTSTANGAIPKSSSTTRSSRSRLRGSHASASASAATTDFVAKSSGNEEQREERASRIQKLEEQCKSLIQQVLETSDNRERLEIQLCRFQDEIAPVQYAVPLDEFINRRRLERMTRASSAPATGTLTPREEEYTRKRSERLGRLEEESRQLMSRIRRTADHGHYLRCSLDRIRRARSREGSFESNTEEEPIAGGVQSVEIKESLDSAADGDVETPTALANSQSPLTEEEAAYIAKRAARLERLEQESKQLLSQLSRNTQRGDTLGNKLDTLHERYSSEDAAVTNAAPAPDRDTSNESPDAARPLSQRLENIAVVTANRQARLRLLEQEGKELLERLSNTAERGEEMINRIKAREARNQARNELEATAEVLVAKDEADTNASSAEIEAEAAAATDAFALKTVASSSSSSSISSIANGQLDADNDSTTTTSSQMGQKHGAIPKTQPQAYLCAAQRQQQRKEQQQQQQQQQEQKELETNDCSSNDNGSESLEDMVKRLRALPYASTEAEAEQQQQQQTESAGQPDAQATATLTRQEEFPELTVQEKECVVEPIKEELQGELAKEQITEELPRQEQTQLEVQLQEPQQQNEAPASDECNLTQAD